MDSPDAGPGELARLLRRLRDAAALTQEELAERAGLTANAIGALERGERRRPYPHTVRALGDALGLDDDERTALAAAARPSGPSGTAAVQLHPASPSLDLSAPPTALVGRDREVAELVALLDPRQPAHDRTGARLVTVTGPGGVGKTRVALEVASVLGASMPAGVAVVELAPVTDVALVPATVARACGLQHSGSGDLLPALAAHLGDRPRLLVLDNVEHLLDAAPWVSELVARCPLLVVLATSRAPLRLRAEKTYVLEPLATPAGSDASAVAASPAAQMLLDRASAVSPRFRLDDDTAASVAAICRRLDGLPLALELAAAHARLLDPDALLARLEQAVGHARTRDLPERQRTMRATLDWSHTLLTRDEQVLLRRLAVFSGGFSLEAAEEVAGDGVDVFSTLGGLVEQSLVVPAAKRHRMLEPVRQYAADHLAAAGEGDEVADRHAAHVLALGRRAREGLRGAQQASWLDRLQAEHGNLQAALGHLLARGRSGEAGRLGADTWLYWALRGSAGEALVWMQRVLASSGGGSAGDDPAAVHVALAGLRFATGDIAGMRGSAAEAVERLQGCSSRDRLADSLVMLGSAALFGGDFETATQALHEAVVEAADDRWALTHAHTAQGQLTLLAGDLAASAASLAEAEVLARDLASPFTLATVLNVQASLARLQDRDDRALEHLLEAGRLAVEVETTWPLVYTLPALAALAAERDLPELAALLFAAGAATAEGSSLAVAFPPDVERAAQQLSAVRVRLGEDEFRRAWARGRGLAPEEAVGLTEQLGRSPGRR